MGRQYVHTYTRAQNQLAYRKHREVLTEQIRTKVNQEPILSASFHRAASWVLTVLSRPRLTMVCVLTSPL